MNVAWCWKFSSFDTHFGARNLPCPTHIVHLQWAVFLSAYTYEVLFQNGLEARDGHVRWRIYFRDLLRTIDAIIKHNKNVVPNDSERKTICELLTQEETWTLKKVDFLNLLSSYMSKSVEENLQTTQRPVNEYLTKRSFNRSTRNQEKKNRLKKYDRSKRCCFIDHSNSVSVVRKLKS